MPTLNDTFTFEHYNREPNLQFLPLCDTMIDHPCQSSNTHLCFVQYQMGS